MQAGTRVRVASTAGAFAGQEGTITRVRTSRTREGQVRKVAEVRLASGRTPLVSMSVLEVA